MIGVLALALSAGAQAPGAFAGTWKLDVAKSTLPEPAPKSVTIMIERTGNERKVAVNAVNAAGAPTKWGYTTVGDGEEAPVMGNPAYDTVSVEATAMEGTVTFRKAGKVVNTLKGVVSPDGMTLTVRSNGVDAKGMPTTGTQVYAKQ